jgi:dephospho-CoA kinase
MGDTPGVHLFGLTGGIASGKSAVASRLRARKLAVMDADAFAREVVAPGTGGLKELVAAFGEGILLPDGSLDRKGLASLVFADEARRVMLNAITHPRISALTMERAAGLATRGEPLACYEAALIIENHMADAFRPLVVVAAPEAVQVERAVARAHSTREDALARIRAQMPLAEKARMADHVIDNHGTLEQLGARTDAVLEAICTTVGVDPRRFPRP